MHDFVLGCDQSHPGPDRRLDTHCNCWMVFLLCPPPNSFCLITVPQLKNKHLCVPLALWVPQTDTVGGGNSATSLSGRVKLKTSSQRSLWPSRTETDLQHGALPSCLLPPLCLVLLFVVLVIKIHLKRRGLFNAGCLWQSWLSSAICPWNECKFGF